MLNKRQQTGLTLIEVMIGISIVSILMVMGLKGYSGWVQNQRVRVAAEAILNGIQIARVEAVKRNSPVQFRLTGTRTEWQVQTVVSAERVQSRSSAEDSAGVLVSSVLPVGATSLSFNGMGRVMTLNPLDNSAPLTQIDVANTGSDRPLRVVVSTSGNVRMCDPNAATGDPRRCL